MTRIRRQVSPHAARLRRDATEVEKKLWATLRNRRLSGHKFRRQATIGPFIVDFLCAEARLIVELDGGQHGGPDDLRRTAFIEAAGYTVLRFWNNDVIGNPQGVLTAIASRLPC